MKETHKREAEGLKLSVVVEHILVLFSVQLPNCKQHVYLCMDTCHCLCVDPVSIRKELTHHKSHNIAL